MSALPKFPAQGLRSVWRELRTDSPYAISGRTAGGRATEAPGRGACTRTGNLSRSVLPGPCERDSPGATQRLEERTGRGRLPGNRLARDAAEPREDLLLRRGRRPHVDGGGSEEARLQRARGGGAGNGGEN